MLNSRHVAELIDKGEISLIKEAMEKALTPGSQTFELCLFKMLREGLITQDEALLNSDSASNLLWLINNTEAGADLAARQQARADAGSKAPGSPSLSSFKLDADQTGRV